MDRDISLLEALGDEAESLAEDIPPQVLNKKLRKVNAAELHFLLQRNIALHAIAPVALERLQGDALLKAGAYPGDLLVALMEANSAFWLENYELWCAVIPVLEGAINTIRERADAEDLGEYMPFYLGDDFMGALMHFRDLFAE